MDLGQLDNPVWYSIEANHAHLANRAKSAANYDDDVSIFGALANIDAGLDPLRELVEKNSTVALLTMDEDLAEDANWRPVAQVPCHQMMCTNPKPAKTDVTLQPLGAADSPAMVELARLTEPGPFGPRTFEMGAYMGIFHGAQLIAMAGERLKPAGWIEVSGVCTHPDARGLGYAAALVSGILEKIHAQDLCSFLHVVKGGASEKTAVRVYERLGFRHHQSVWVHVLQRIG